MNAGVDPPCAMRRDGTKTPRAAVRLAERAGVFARYTAVSLAAETFRG
jgi:hypothetical protein